MSNTTPQKTKGKTNLIGSGSYGKVYIHEDDPSKVTKRSSLKEFETNILESTFFGTFCTTIEFQEFIPIVYNITFDKKKIDITMENCGQTLHSWVNSTPYSKRMEFFPNIICQLARILLFFKRYKLSHMDLKPSNICIDDKGKIKVIDFGFVCKDIGQEKISIGTHCITDPRLHRDERIPLWENDMFSVGVIGLFVIVKDYFDATEEFKACADDYDLENFYEFDKITDSLNKDYISLIRSMLSLENRISPIKLYTHFKVHSDYPIIFIKLYYEKFCLGKNIKIEKGSLMPQHKVEYFLENDIRKGMYYDFYKKESMEYLLQILKSLRLFKHCTHAIKIFNKYERLSTKFAWTRNNIRLITVGVIGICIIVFNDYDNTIETLCDFIEEYPLEIIKKSILDIIFTLNYKVFPREHYCEEKVIVETIEDKWDKWTKFSLDNYSLYEEAKIYNKEVRDMLYG